MAFTDKINKRGTRTISENINTDNFEFRKLVNCCGDEFRIFGFLKTHGKYGESVALVTPTCFISLPDRYVDVFDNLTTEEIEKIKSGIYMVRNIRPLTTRNGSTAIFDVDEV